MVSFQDVKDTLKLFRSLSKKERFDLELLGKFLGREKLRQIKISVRQGRVSIIKKKMDLSFLISGSTLMPSLVSEIDDLSALNEVIERKHRKELFDDFSERAFDVLPQFVAPELVGFVEEKQAAALALFSGLKLLFVGEGGEIVDSFGEIGDVEKLAFVKRFAKTLDVDEYNFVFFSKAPVRYSFDDVIDKVLVDNQRPVSGDDMDFVREYVAHVSKIPVRLPRNLFKHIRGFVRRKKASKPDVAIGEMFVRGVVELAKGSARAGMRRFVTHKDLERAFKIAEQANKK